MPALSTLVLTDRQTTPVNVSLLPNGVKDGVGRLAVTDASGAIITEMVYTVSTRVMGNGKIKSIVQFNQPTIVTEVINGVSMPAVAREQGLRMEYFSTKLHTEAERNNFIGMFASSLMTSKTVVNDALVKAQSVWGG